jgi:hypothetical protein
MAQNTPIEMVRHASTLSILWGVLPGAPCFAFFAKRGIPRRHPSCGGEDLRFSTSTL